MTAASALARYAGYLETLTPAGLEKLDELVHPHVRFADPFHDLRGAPAMRAVFTSMFETIPDVRFQVLESAGAGKTGFLRWRFTGHFATHPSRQLDFEGTSVVQFDDQGLVIEHLDYWDSAGGLLQLFPVIGPVLRWVRRRVAASAGPLS